MVGLRGVKFGLALEGKFVLAIMRYAAIALIRLMRFIKSGPARWRHTAILEASIPGSY